MKRIGRKLNSQTGASITYALLIFLVCAVVGSAVLVAGTAASGRMSEVAEYDQRYYAVTSAARLIIDMIHDEPVTIIKEEVDTGTPPVQVHYYKGSVASGNLISSTTTFDSILTQAAYQVMSGGAPYSNTLNLTSSISELQVGIEETINSYGQMIVEITKTTGSSPNSKTYGMKLMFYLDAVYGEPDDSIPGTIITENTYTWHLRDIQVVGSQRWT